MKSFIQLGTYFLIAAAFSQAQAQILAPAGTYTLTARTCADGTQPEDGQSPDLINHLSMTVNGNQTAELDSVYGADRMSLHYSYWIEGSELYSILNGMRYNGKRVSDPFAYAFMKAASLGYYLPSSMAQRLPMTSHRHIESVSENQIVLSQTPMEAAAGTDKKLPLSCLASGKMILVFSKLK